jgi:hypothetical protein
MTAVLVAVMGVCGAVAGALSAYLISRRTASGRVDTSQADQLWGAMQQLNEMTQARLVRAEDQRDRLIESYTNGIVPALGEINAGLRLITEAVEKHAVAHE